MNNNNNSFNNLNYFSDITSDDIELGNTEKPEIRNRNKSKKEKKAKHHDEKVKIPHPQHNPPVETENFGVEPGAVVNTAAKVVDVGTKAGGFTLSMTQLIVVVVISTVIGGLALGFASFYLNQYINIYNPFFSNEVPILRNISNNIKANDSGTFIACAGGDISFCTLNQQVQVIQQALSSNFSFGVNGTINSTNVFDQNQASYQDVINDNTKTDITNLKGRMTTAEGNIVTLESYFIGGQLYTPFVYDPNQNLTQDVINNNTKLDITNLKGRMTTTEGNVGTLQGQMVTAQADIATVKGYFVGGELYTPLVYDPNQNLTQDVINNNTKLDITSLKGRMTTAEGDIITLEGQMSTVQITVTNLISNDSYLLGLIGNLTGTVNNIGSNVANGSIFSNQVFDVPRNKTQKEVNDELYANDLSQQSQLTSQQSQLTSQQSQVSGIQAKFVNGSIITPNVYDPSFNQTQAYINQYFNSTIASILANSSLSLPPYKIIQVDGIVGNDLTCDGSILKPCASYTKAQSLMISSSILYVVVFNAGTYSESLSIPLKPNQILLGNEGVSLAFNGGISFNAVAWNTTGSGTVIFKNFKALQCSGTCLLDSMILNPSVSFSFRFIDCAMTFSTLLTVDGFLTDSSTSSSVTFEGSTSILGGVVFLSDVRTFEWSGTGSNYGTLQLFRNTTSGTRKFKFNGLINNGGSITIMNTLGSIYVIDVTIIRLIQLNNATFTLNRYASGLDFAIHADLSIGVTSGGLIITGPGGHTMEYLQYAVGLGFVASNPSYWTALGFSVPVEVNTALDDLAAAAYSDSNRLTALETVPNVPIVFVEIAGNDLNCVVNNQRLPCATPKRASQLMGNLSDSNTPWIFQFGTGYWFLDPTFLWPCNVIFRGTESSVLYMTGTTLDFGKAVGANGGACITKLLYMSIVPQTDILIDFSSVSSLTYIEIDWLNCTINNGAFSFAFTGNTGFNIMNFDFYE